MNCANDKERAAVEYLKAKRIVASASLVRLVLSGYTFDVQTRRERQRACERYTFRCSRCGREWTLSRQQIGHASTTLAIRSHRMGTKLCDETPLRKKADESVAAMLTDVIVNDEPLGPERKK